MRLALVLLGLMLSACQGEATWVWHLPAGFPEPPVPSDNPMSATKVELGRRLFYDTRLSVDGEMACATCHKQELAFTDGRPVGVGTTGEAHTRSSMSLANVAYASRLSWADPDLDRLEDQARAPLFGEHPVEMGLAGMEAEVVATLAADATYQRLFPAAFPDDPAPVSIDNVTRAIAAFERTLVSGDSAYDRYAAGDTSALTEAQVRGMGLFFSERLECFHCHAGFNFSDSVDHQGLPTPQVAFHHTGLYDVDGHGGYPAREVGLAKATERAADHGKFRAPTLRNIAVTAPYMHDGSVSTLRDVLEHYANGGRAPSARVSEFVPGFVLTDGETEDLLAFLAALTDEEFLSDPRFADPFSPTSP